MNKLPLLMILLLLLWPMVQAKEVARTAGLSQKVYERMQEIQELIEDDQVSRAYKKLQSLEKRDLSDYERAQTWFMMGYVRYRQEDYPAARGAYEKVLLAENLPLGMQTNVLKTLSQLCMIMEDYSAALDYLDRLLALSEEPVPNDHALKAQVLYQMERYDDSMTSLDTAIRLQAKRGERPRENWLLLKNALLYQRDDLKGMVKVNQLLLELYPRDRYVLTLASLYGELGDQKTQLSLMEPLYEKGSLQNPSQQVSLASLYMLQEIPYKAARLLEKEMAADSIESNERNLEMLAQAWLMSADIERSLEPQSRAAKLAEDGEGYVVLARTYMSLLRWKDAERSLEKAVDKGGLRDSSGAQLMLGMVQFNQKNYREARRSFAEAGKDPKSEKLAQQWLDYLEREEEKMKLAAEAAEPA